jgi:uncharacterized protein
MEWYMYLAVIGVGICAGFINTLAGGGSALSLPMLIFLGLPPNTANGTNRIAIFLQTIVAVGGFKSEKVFDRKNNIRLGIPALVGAIPGAFIATELNEQTMKIIIGVVLIIMLALVIFKPGVWLNTREGKPLINHPVASSIVFFLIGAYGGFIQVGVGFFLLAGLVLANKMNLVKANAIKVFIVMLYTPLALLVFILHHQVDYKIGLVLAAGNMLGAWIGSKAAVKKGAGFVRYILIIALVLSSAKLFGLLDFILG